MASLFVTATGTDVGKTFLTAGLIQACRRAGCPVTALKPIVSGFDESRPDESDMGLLLSALGRPVTAGTIAAFSPWRFRAPLSPDMAAAMENRTIDFAALVAFSRRHREETGSRLMLFEGIGGVMVPLGAGRTVLDWITALGVPVLLVSPTGLGAISHLLTAVEALKGRALAPAAIVLSETPLSGVPLALMVQTLQDFVPPASIFVLRRADEDHAAIFDRLLARVAMNPLRQD